jgi:uncharacterized MnhB-related membrane protein
MRSDVHLMKNARGRPDFLMTAAALATLTVLLKVLLNGVVVRGVNLGVIDPMLVGAVLAPTLGAYTLKRVKVDKENRA